MVARYIRKDIESYGTLKVTDAGHEFLKTGETFKMSDDHTYHQEDSMPAGAGKAAALDDRLVKMLKELRKKVADQKKVPPYVVFQDPSIDDMATKYPITLEEMANIHGVGDGKARKFGKPFVDLIARYVEDNDIERADDMVIKSKYFLRCSSNPDCLIAIRLLTFCLSLLVTIYN